MTENTDPPVIRKRGRKSTGGRRRDQDGYVVVSGTVPEALRDDVWDTIPKSQRVDEFIEGLLRDWLTGRQAGAQSPSGLTRLPIVGSVAGGAGALARESAGEYVTLPPDLFHGASFALTVTGDSMAPGILENDLVLVRQQPDAQNNQIVVAVFDEDRAEREGSVKRLRREFGVKELRSDNEEYPPIVESFEIVGIVVGLIRRME